MQVPLDRNGLEVLDRPECLRLLAGKTVGRLAAWGQSGPVVLPVNYALVDDEVVVGTGLESELHDALAHEPVAFEVDDVDVGYEWGWSVLVRGRGRHINDSEDVEQVRRRLLRSWGPGERRRFTAIATTEVTGRRIGLHGVRQM